ncbi:helix-turn-helix domain-containing protein [Pediococcus acidilactici]|nr:helix-turn-helix domain-containing protein [Pediococcus acidilactici]
MKSIIFTGGIQMNPRALHMLSQTNIVEEKQKIKRSFVEDMPSYVLQTGELSDDKIQILNNNLFKNRDVYISRHNRYAPYPAHSHTFFEMNYMLQGHATEIVNDQRIELQTGDLLLLDIGAKHQIAVLGDHDILVNILFKRQVISINLLNDIRRSNSILHEFLIDRAIDDATGTKNFLLFKHKSGHEIPNVLDKVIEEYYLKRDFSNSIIKSYLQILFVLLVRHYPLDIGQHPTKQQILVTKILKQIAENYQTIRLDDLARKYKYSKNYLGNLFKEVTGKTFTQAVTQQRLIQARNLISSTNLPITEIMHQIGITNKTFFYKKYEEFYHGKPGDDR